MGVLKTMEERRDIKDLLEEVKRKANEDIVSLIGEYVPLKRVGSSYQALCPFHSERTPSFYVNPHKGVWKCFGCGKGGDAVKFVAEIEGITYGEALRRLAERYGIKLPTLSADKHSKEYTLLEALTDAFYSSLIDNKEARRYLKERGVPNWLISEWKIGYCPPKRLDNIPQEDREILEKLKLLKGNRLIFADRITFPIRDRRGRVVGFTARLLKEDPEKPRPKYLNSPNSHIFDKSKLLFGFFEALPYLREKKTAIIVEGVFDVLLLHSIGIRNTVAPLGTALTECQAKQLLSEGVNEVILLFDNDKAGRSAIFKTASILYGLGLEVRVIKYPSPDYKDPADLVQNLSTSEVRSFIDTAPYLLQKLIEGVEKGNIKQREQAFSLIRQYLKLLKPANPPKALAWAMEVKDRLGIPVCEILDCRKGEIRYWRPRKKLNPSYPQNLYNLDAVVETFLDNLTAEDCKNLDLYYLPERAKEMAETKCLNRLTKLEETEEYKVAKEILMWLKLQEETIKELSRLEEKIFLGEASKTELEKFRLLVNELGISVYRQLKKFFNL